MTQIRLSILLFLSSVSFADGADGRPIVAKFVSGECDGSVEWVSSATLFVREEGRVHLLTSSERAFQGEAYCHRYELPDGTQGEARLRHLDWGTNLAVFDTQLGREQVRGPSVGSPTRQSAIVHYFDAVQGKFLSQKLRIVSNWSTRHFFPTLSSVDELIGAALPSSVVGAPILSEDEGLFLGMVSSEHVVEVPGASARIEEWSVDPNEKRSHLTAIKRFNIDSWIVESEKPGFRIPYGRHPGDQIRGVSRVTSGQLSFTADCPKPGTPRGKGGYPIGGVDAAGIGGASVSNPPCKIRVEKAEKPVEFAYPGRLDLHDLLLRRLEQGAPVEILLGYDREDGYLLGRALVSLGTFFGGLKIESQKFLMTWGKPDSVPGLELLQGLGKQLASHALEFYRFYLPLGSERAYLQGMLLSSSAWNEVKVEDAEILLQDCLTISGICHQSLAEDLERIIPELRKAGGR